MRLHTLDDIHRTVSASALEKAWRLHRRGAALVSDMSDDGTRIDGRVQGTQRHPYTITIHLDRRADGKVRIDGSCSCPVGFNCKHVAALLIETMGAPEQRRHVPAANEPALPSLAESWLDDLDRALGLSEDAYPPSIRQRLIYVLSIAHGDSGPPLPVLDLRSVRLRKDDTFSRTVSTYDPQSAVSGTPAKFLRGQDMRILRHVLHLRELYGYGSGRGHTLCGETGPEVLALVLATGRCRWQSLDGPVMTAGEERRGRLCWTLMDTGAQKPVVSVEGGGTAVCLTPPWYVDAEAAVCGPLQIGVPPRVAAVLMQAPGIEPQHVTELRGKLAERLPDHEQLLPQEQVPPEAIGGPPTPVLRLTRQTVSPGYGGYVWSRPSPARDMQVAHLAFAYGSVVLPAHEPREKPLFAQGGRLFAVDRNRPLENRHRKRLAVADIGLAAIQAHAAYGVYGTYGLPPEARSILVHASDDPLAWPRFLVEVAPRLREEGWRIEIEPGFTPPFAEIEGDVDAVLQEGSGIDWFEFTVGVPVDGQRVNLLPHIVSLLKSVPDDADSDFFDLDAADLQTLFVALDDGRLLPLPYARLKPILAALHELFRVDLTADGGKLHLRRSRAVEVAALEDLLARSGIAWSGGEALRSLGRRLREVGGIGEYPSPHGFAATLRPYQVQGYSWLQFLGETGLGGVLADDMGLGKTVQALAHVLAEKQSGRADRPSLVVAPTSLMPNWRMETQRFAPALKVLTLHGSDRKARFDVIPGHDLVLSTYALLPRDHEVLQAQPWHAVIVDEAQNVKNPDTNAARILRQLDTRQRFCLTGTPVENHLGELWALMDFVNPGLLGDRRHFARTFRAPIEKNDDATRRHALARRVRPFLLRRTKAEVAAELPAKTEIIEPIEMEAAQSTIYEAVRLTMHQKVREALATRGLDRSRIIILDALLKLRQVCCDPRLVKLPSIKKSGAASAKLARLMQMLEELVEEGRRVLLLSQFTSMLALIEERLAAAEIAFAKITGEVQDRATPVQRFQAGEVPVFLISLKAGGTGLNLTAADTVILYDPWWNPAVEAQAIDRSHRIGQNKPVFVHRLVTLNTIEEKMLELQRRKGALVAGLFDPEAGGPLDITADDIELLLAGA